MTPVAERSACQSGYSKEGSPWDTSHKLYGYSTGCKQSLPASMTTLDKLGPSLTRMIRTSTVICYASERQHDEEPEESQQSELVVQQV